MALRLTPVHLASAAILLPWLAGCAPQSVQPYAEAALPYSACGRLADLRSTLTGSPDRTANSDAVLHRLGVRCIGDRDYPAAAGAR